MTVTAHCPTCNRTVYLADEDTAACPVCSSPLLSAIEEGDALPDEEAAQTAAVRPVPEEPAAAE